MRPTAEEKASRNSNQVPETVLKKAYFAEVPVSLINPDSDQPRTFCEEGEEGYREQEEDLKALALSIDFKGQVIPALLRLNPEEEGRFIIIAGERRWRAVKKYCARVDFLRALICPVYSGSEAYELSVVENVHRRKLSPLDEAQVYYDLRTKRAMSQVDISRMTGMSQMHVSDYLCLLKLHPEARRLLSPSLPEKKRLGITAAVEISRNYPPHLHMEKAEFYMRKGVTLRELREDIAESAGQNGRPKGGKGRGNSHRAVKTHMKTLESVFRISFPTDEAVWSTYHRHGRVPLNEIEETLTVARRLSENLAKFTGALEKVKERKVSGGAP